MDPGHGPRVSVVIPARNEEHAISALLDRLAGQTFTAAEILVVDAGSTDRTREIVARHPVARLLDAGPAYPGRARNVGIEAAAHDWVALVDAGCYPAANWLEELVRPVRETGPRVVFGRCDPVLDGEWDLAQAVVLVPPIDQSGTRGPTTVSLLLHRTLWREVGGFPGDLRAAEDLLFFARLSQLAPPSAQAARAVVTWDLAPNVGAYYRRLRLYSLHHLRAGFFRTWHLRVMAMDVAAIVLIACSLLVHPLFLVLACTGMAARLLRTVQRGASNIGGARAFRPDRLLRVALLLLLADVAVWAGAFDFLRLREPRTAT